MTLSSCFALAVHALALLAHQGEEGATSALIASSASTHPARVRRVLATLGRAGLVRGREGAGGGYVLARPAESITLAAVFQALGEGPILPLHPREPNSACAVGAGITAALERVDAELEVALRGALSRRSIAWLAGLAAQRDGAPDP